MGILVTAALCLPHGFLLGTPFPAGIRLLASEHRDQTPLAWGINGVASVVGSLGAAIGAKSYGFSAMLLCGAAYGIALILLIGPRVRRSDLARAQAESPVPANR